MCLLYMSCFAQKICVTHEVEAACCRLGEITHLFLQTAMRCCKRGAQVTFVVLKSSAFVLNFSQGYGDVGWISVTPELLQLLVLWNDLYLKFE